MNEILDIEIILKKQKYPFVYNIGVIIIIILLIFLYVSFTYSYKTYYITKGTIKDNYLELIVNITDMKYITNNNIVTIDNKLYHYSINKISEDLYVDELYNNYKNIYLKVDDLYNVNNYVYEIKLVKENKKLIEYLKDYV
jgi:hypothetical protein